MASKEQIFGQNLEASNIDLEVEIFRKICPPYPSFKIIKWQTADILQFPIALSENVHKLPFTKNTV